MVRNVEGETHDPSDEAGEMFLRKQVEERVVGRASSAEVGLRLMKVVRVFAAEGLEEVEDAAGGEECVGFWSRGWCTSIATAQSRLGAEEGRKILWLRSEV